MSTMVRAPSEVKVGKTIEIAADWARPSVLPPEPSLSLSLPPSSCCGLGWALGPFSSLSLSLSLSLLPLCLSLSLAPLRPRPPAQGVVIMVLVADGDGGGSDSEDETDSDIQTFFI